MSIWFTADHHIGHYNIIQYTMRPYMTTSDMDADLIERWNSVVKPDDTVFNIGDFIFPTRMSNAAKVSTVSDTLSVLNGKIILIEGNHDKHCLNMTNYKSRISEVHKSLEMCLFDMPVFLVHRPIEASPKCPTLAGHVHQEWRIKTSGSVIRE